jgi:hypothetical protein
MRNDRARTGLILNRGVVEDLCSGGVRFFFRLTSSNLVHHGTAHFSHPDVKMAKYVSI